MLRSFLRVSVASVLAGGAWLACVGDDPAASVDEPKKEGELGASCFANATCNAGLECFETVCVPMRGDGSPSGHPDADTTGFDGGVDADAGGPCNETLAPQTAGPRCLVGAGQCPNQVCCLSPIGNNGCVPSLAACDSATNVAFACTENRHCTSGNACCLSLTKAQPACPTTLETNGGSRCQQACGANPQLCTSDGECPTGKCRPATVTIGGGTLKIGYCTTTD